MTTRPDDPSDVGIEEVLAVLSLEEKVQLLTGRDFWSTNAIERIGLRSMTLSDGPSGVRGPVWDERSPSLNLPSASALSSSFDTAIARRYGAVAAAEARRKGVDVVLGPTINLHRSPRGGRHFEAFSEDPVLTAELAAAYVDGLQANGVGATPKHYVANDSETDRFTVDARVDERALRELYLLAFEKAIVESRAWLVMSSYNSINGVTATENDLLETPLNSEWGFDGVVVSDWTAVRSLASATASQDLVMPGPDGPWGAALVDAVRSGTIPEETIDRKVRRLLLLAARVGALGEPEALTIVDPEDGREFAREAAAEGAVLLENKGELPWDPASLTRVAVIGSNAEFARTQGGGSATVLPDRTVSPLQGLREALPGAEVTYSVGATNLTGIAGVPRDRMTNPATGGRGAHVRFVDGDGKEIFSEDRLSTELVWFGGDASIVAAREVVVEFGFTPERSERVDFGFAAAGHGRMWIDGSLVIDAVVEPEGSDLGAAFLDPPLCTARLDLVAGVPISVRFVYENAERDGGLSGALTLSVGLRHVDDDPDGLVAAAVEAARSADVALVVVGTNANVESEGFDRTTLALPGRQDELVRAVAAANPRTVVLVNSGAPVLMPWREDVAAVLLGWFGGQEFGAAIADVLIGVREPGGRLPTTWPADEHDAPVLDVVPADGRLTYDEGIHIGYRAWLRAGTSPAYWFGHGLSYSQAELRDLTVPPSASPGDRVTVHVEVANTGRRRSKAVVLVFAEKPDSDVDRAVRWLVGFSAVRLRPGEITEVDITIPTRLLAHWSGKWTYEEGAYNLLAGTTADHLPLSAVLHLATSGTTESRTSHGHSRLW